MENKKVNDWYTPQIEVTPEKDLPIAHDRETQNTETLRRSKEKTFEADIKHFRRLPDCKKGRATRLGTFCVLTLASILSYLGDCAISFWIGGHRNIPFLMSGVYVGIGFFMTVGVVAFSFGCLIFGKFDQKK